MTIPRTQPPSTSGPVATEAPSLKTPRRVRLVELGFLLAVLAIAIVLGWALTPGLFALADPLATDTAARLLAPSLAHPFGTDELGRDLYSRVVYGAGNTIGAAVLAMGLALIVGVTIGLIAGQSDGWLSGLLMRAVDVSQALPAILIALVIIAASGNSMTTIAIALSIAGVGAVARVTRTSVMVVRKQEYVDAARINGMGEAETTVRHILPNAAGPVLAMCMTEFAGYILAISSLSFLGFGAPPPQPEWGALVEAGRMYLPVAWWMSVLPGVVIMLVALSANRLAQQLQWRKAK